MKKNTFITFFACMSMLMCVFCAQAASPVKWDAKIQMSSATDGVVVLTADIQDGWHVYGTNVPEDGPSATKIYYSGKGVKFEGNVKATPKALKEMDDMFGMEVTYWCGKVTFTRKIKVTDASAAEVRVTVDYMSCNDANCRPPVKESFTLKVPR